MWMVIAFTFVENTYYYINLAQMLHFAKIAKCQAIQIKKEPKCTISHPHHYLPRIRILMLPTIQMVVS